MSTVRAGGRHRITVATVVTGLLVASWGPGASDARPSAPPRPASVARPAQEEDDGSLKAEYDEVIGREAELVARVQRAAAERERLNGELSRLQSELKAKEVELVNAQVDLNDAEMLAMIYAQALKDAQAKFRTAKERLRRQIVATYVNGGVDASVMAAVLRTANGQDVGSVLAYSDAVVGDTEDLVRRLEAARETMRKTDKLARSSRKKSREVRDKVQAAALFIKSAADQKQQLVDEVNLTIADEAEALRDVQGRKALIEGRINAMSQSSDGIAMIVANIQRRQPDWVPGDVVITTPTPGRFISSPFGMRFHPILHISRLHAGGDIGAPSGTPIHAAADGVVIVASVHGGYGNTTVIDHGHSLATLYGHQSVIVVQVGDVVKRGDVIGLVGSTGLSTGPHLHFETRVKGMPIDPVGVVDFHAEVDYHD
jgi:murein DD-endopeptidase MepM/ murein hydrolase activator NlpD